MTNVTCVLHHHIGPESPFEAGLNISTARASYEAQIEWLRERYNFISLEQLLFGDLPRRPLLLTFDDAFQSVIEIARDVLSPRKIPSVFFVNPGLLENGAISLDSALAWATNTVGLAEICKLLGLPVRSNLGDIISRDMAKCGALERQEIIGRLIYAYGQPDLHGRAPLLKAEDLKELGSLGVEIGNHTMTHVHCRSLSRSERETEIVESKRLLEELSGVPVRALSIPYGHEHDLPEAVLQCARDSGHAAIFLVHARANWRRPSHDVWYRTSLHNESPARLNAEISIKPHLRTIKKMVLG